MKYGQNCRITEKTNGKANLQEKHGILCKKYFGFLRWGARKSLFFTSLYLHCDKVANKQQQKYAHLQINRNTFFTSYFFISIYQCRCHLTVSSFN